MRFSVEIRQEEVPLLINEFVGIAGAAAWQKRFTWLDQELTENEYMRDWLLERCALEFALMEVVAQGELQHPRMYRLDLPGRYELAAFAAGVVAIHRQLTAAAQTRLRGQMIDGLKSEKGLSSLQHEVSTAVHLVQCGFELTCHDLENGGGFDYLAEREGLQIEVECKMFSGDLGCRIHKRAQAKLFRRMRDRLLQILNGLKVGLLVRVTLPVRLSSADGQHEHICMVIEKCMLSGEACRSEECFVSLREFDVAKSPFRSAPLQIDQGKAREFVIGLTGNRNPSLAAMFNEAGQVLIVVFESAKRDDVLGGMRHQLREAAAGQFTGGRPGVLVAQIQDLTNDQLLELAESDSSDRASAHGLQKMTSDLLHSESRKHVHSVIYRGKSVLLSNQGIVTSQGVSYFMRNEFHPLAQDSRFTLFGDFGAKRPKIVT